MYGPLLLSHETVSTRPRDAPPQNLAVNFRLPVTVHIAPQWRPASELGISHAREQIQERVVEMFEEARAVAVVTEATAGSTGMESSGTNSGGTGLGALNYAVDVGVEWLVADKDQTAKKLQTLDGIRPVRDENVSTLLYERALP